MEIYINAIICGSIWIVLALFFWKIYPIIKDNAVFKKAMEIVHTLEEDIGGGNGEIKFESAVTLLQTWTKRLGWKIDIGIIYDTITAAVSVLHTEQGKLPSIKYELTEDGELKAIE